MKIHLSSVTVNFWLEIMAHLDEYYKPLCTIIQVVTWVCGKCWLCDLRNWTVNRNVWQEKLIYFSCSLYFSKSTWFTLTAQRFSIADEFLYWMHTIRFLTLNIYSAPMNVTRRWKRLSHKYVQLYMHAPCSWLLCAWGSRGPHLPWHTLSMKQGPSTLPHHNHSKL